MTTVTFIFVTYHSREEIENCLRSIVPLVRLLPLTVETIVVDNNSKDGTDFWLLNNISTMRELNIHLIFNEKNLQLSKATNQALAVSTGDYIILANPDVIFNEGLARFIHYGTGEYADAIIAPSLLNLDGTPQHSIHSRATDITRIFFSFAEIGHVADKFITGEWFRKHYSYREYYGKTMQVFQLGTMLMMSRKTLEKIGGAFDERLPLYFGDVDLAMRAEENGVKSFVIGDVAFHHVRGHSFKKEQPFLQRYIFGRDLAMFCRIHHVPLWLIRSMLFLDAICAVPVTLVLRVKRPRLWRSWLRFSAEQVRGILS